MLSTVLIFTLVASGFASPLVFKSTKEVTSDADYVELGTIDATKYRQIRISISNVHPEALSRTDYSVFWVRLDMIEGEDQLLFQVSREQARYSTAIETPPSHLKIRVKGKGIFKLYVWAS